MIQPVAIFTIEGAVVVAYFLGCSNRDPSLFLYNQLSAAAARTLLLESLTVTELCEPLPPRKLTTPGPS